MPVHITDLVIEKLIVHEVYKRNEERQFVTPKFSETTEHLHSDALQVITKRIIDACGRDSHCIQMDLKNTEVNSVFHHVGSSILGSEVEFIEKSKLIALNLARAQTSRGYPGGEVVCFSGTISSFDLPCFGIIKSEKHEGFTKDTDRMIFLKNLFLTPSQRLYKIGIFVEIDEQTRGDEERNSCDFEVYVFDHLLKKSEAKAALYFYNTFLGCEFMQDGKRTTADFYNKTLYFINENPKMTDEQKIDLLSSLYVYLKIDTQTSIGVADFSTRYLSEPVLRDEYRNYCEREGLPATAFQKDLSIIKSKLKKRKLKFTNNITIDAPTRDFDQLVKIIEVKEKSTLLEITGRLRDQS